MMLLSILRQHAGRTAIICSISLGLTVLSIFTLKLLAQSRVFNPNIVFDIIAKPGTRWEPSLTNCAGNTNGGKLTVLAGGVIDCSDDISGGGGGPTGIELLLPPAGLVAPPTAGWSWVNQGTATVSQDSNGRIHLQTPSNASVNGRIRTRSFTAPQTATAGTFLYTGQADGFAAIGLRESGSGKLVFVGIAHNSGDPGDNQFQISKWNSATSFNSNAYVGANIPHSNIYWFQVENDDTTIFFRVSTDRR